MDSSFDRVKSWLRCCADSVAVALLLAVFIAFLFQIMFRYVFGWPTGWAFELSIMAWLWIVLWGAAFVVREQDEIRFDIILGLASPGTRRIFAIVTGLALVSLYAISLPAVADYVLFMKVERSAYLGIRFDLLYSAYLVFAAAAIIRYVWLTWAALRGAAPRSSIDRTAGDSAS